MVNFNFPKSQFPAAQIPTIKRLLDLVQAKKVIEIGSWVGESTSIIADHIKPGMVYSVDWFKGNEGTDLSKLADSQDIYKIFKSNIEELGLEKYVQTFVMESTEAAKFFSDNFADLVFIDATHNYLDVKKDIAAWLPKVRDGGIICGHDCESKEWDERYINQDVFEHKHHGVIKAVNEAFSNFNIEERIWWKIK